MLGRVALLQYVDLFYSTRYRALTVLIPARNRLNPQPLNHLHQSCPPFFIKGWHPPQGSTPIRLPRTPTTAGCPDSAADVGFSPPIPSTTFILALQPQRDHTRTPTLPCQMQCGCPSPTSKGLTASKLHHPIPRAVARYNMFPTSQVNAEMSTCRSRIALCARTFTAPGCCSLHSQLVTPAPSPRQKMCARARCFPCRPCFEGPCLEHLSQNGATTDEE